MLHRTKKEQDENAGKWVGVGGKLEPGESPDACLVREVKEETGFTLHGWRFRGVVSFLSDIYEAEQMFLFTSEDFSGVLHECDEGELAWVEKEKVPGLPLWEGDRVFLRLRRRMRRRFCSRCVTKASGWCRLCWTACPAADMNPRFFARFLYTGRNTFPCGGRYYL